MKTPDHTQENKRERQRINAKKFYADKKRLHITFTQDEYSLVEKAAGLAGVSPTRFVYETIMEKTKPLTYTKRGQKGSH